MSQFAQPTSNAQREDDLAMLEELTRHGELGEQERDAFIGMLDRLRRRGGSRFIGGLPSLTADQRQWATRRAEQIGISWGDPAKRNAHIPRGAEVETPEVLRKLPKKPPVRVRETR